MKSTLKFEKLSIPSANLGPENSLPSISRLGDADFGYRSELGEDDGLYVGYGMVKDIFPYRIQDLYDRDLKDREINVAVLENQHLRATFAPDLGGKLLSLFDKDNNSELLFRNPVFQPCNLALRNAWTSGGVEWNIGMVGHSPFTCSTMFTATVNDEDGTPILRMYEFERIRRVTYQMDFYLPENSKFLHCRMRIVNPNNYIVPMYWWSNIAVPENKKSRVVVAASEAYTSEIIDGDRVVMKLDIPYCDGFDATYPTNTENLSRDYFYRTDDNKPRYIAYVDENGYGLLQTSTSLLKGRKLFVWGQGPGAKHWEDYLARPGEGDYVEIQAGLARSQYEHLPMPPNTAWEWIEVYGAVKCKPGKVHGDFSVAQTEVEKQLKKSVDISKLEDELKATKQRFALKPAENIVFKGSGWGQLENQLRNTLGTAPLSSHLDFGNAKKEQKSWASLIKYGTVGEHDPNEVPASWMLQAEFTEMLKKAVEDTDKDNWYAWLQLGTIYMINGDIALAEKALKTSVKCANNCWSCYCLAVLSLRKGDKAAAKKYALSAIKLKNDDVSLNKAVFSVLNKCEAYSDVIKLYLSSQKSTVNNSRARIEYVYALAHSGEYQAALDILTENGGFVLNDVREEEVTLSDLYTYVKREIAKANVEAETEFPIPQAIDFRVKPEEF